jgi:hypothetical protein
MLWGGHYQERESKRRKLKKVNKVDVLAIEE